MSLASRLVAVLFLSLVAFASGFSFRDVMAGRSPSTTALGQLLTGKPKAVPTPVELFQEHYTNIKSSYWRTLPADHLRFSAMEGMFASLGDPHTNYLKPSDAEQLKLETRGDFVGIGARLAPDPLGAKISTVFKQAPAFKAGLKPGDTIVQVDQRETAGMVTEDIVSLIRGKEGTTVKLKLTRTGNSEPIVVSIKRAVVEIPTADGRMLEGTNVGYISISQFAETTVEQFDTALADIQKGKAEGLVIDVRGNPGGLLESAAKLLARFAPDKIVVKMRGKGGNEQFVTAPGGREVQIAFPIVILTNEESASASEIFAGVMQEYKKATLVGEHTYGKASVQNVFPLIDLSSAKITVAKYYLPSGADIGRVVDEDGEYLRGGLKPDVQQELTIDANTVIGDPKKDSQLARAIEVIKSKRG